MPWSVAYVDCFSGASGDMLLGALLHAGLELADLQADLALLPVQGYHLEALPQLRRGISGIKLVVHEDTPSTADSGPVRNLATVRRLVQQSSLPQPIIADSLRVFERLAVAEGRIHGIDPEEVHFHELSGIDALVDIVGFCAGLRRLGVEQLYASPLPLAGGAIRTAHGLLPAPAPATLELLAEVGAPTIPSPARGELVTPTGAALLSTLATFAQPAMAVRRVGYGFGAKEFPWANMLRIWLGDAVAGQPQAHEHAHHHEDTQDNERELGHDHDHAHPHHHEHHDPNENGTLSS